MVNSAALSTLPTPLRALVVGGTAGIGLGIAQYIANAVPSSHVTIAGRNATVANEICKDAVNGNMSFKRIDASLMANVRTFCQEFSAESRGSKLDILVLSQGILGLGGNLTSEGIETVVALNYYSRMLFIRELLSSNTLSKKAIIVSILNGENGDSSGKSILWDNMDISRTPKGIRGFMNLKSVIKHNMSMEDIMMQDLSIYPPPPASDALPSSGTQSGVGMTLIHSYPGFVTTDILNKSPDFPGWLKWTIGTLSTNLAKYVTPEQAAPLIMDGAVRVWQAQNEKIEKGEQPVRGWFCMSEKGDVYDKPEASEDVRRRVREHTWTLVDQAMDGGVKNSG